MAIGDTVQAGLMRVDSSPILLAGQAQAQANQAFGNAVGGVVEKFYQKKKDKQERDEREQAYLKMGLTSEEAKAASRDKDLANQFINKMNADRNFLIEQEKAKIAADLFNFQKQDYENRFEERERLLGEAEENELADNQFIAKIVGSSSVPTGQLNEAGQDELERGSLFIAPTKEAVSDFKDTLLRDPSTQTKVPMMDLDGNQFIRQFSEDSPEVQRRALNFMQARQKDAPKPMTPMEEAELKKLNLANRKTEFELSDLETPKTDYKAGPTIVEDNIFRALDIIKESPRTTTGMGSYLSNIPGTDAKSLKERLASIKANIGFDYLQAMREASPTGGALGNVSDKELQGLQSVFGSLEQSLDDAELTYNLNLLNYTYNNVIHGEGNHNVLDPRKGGSSPQQSANTIDPADLENAIQAKRKLLEQRKMMQQTLDNPNVPNYGPQ
jgi:hypothetical protein